jgi:hypothetical protein
MIFAARSQSMFAPGRTTLRVVDIEPAPELEPQAEAAPEAAPAPEPEPAPEADLTLDLDASTRSVILDDDYSQMSLSGLRAAAKAAGKDSRGSKAQLRARLMAS